MMLVLELVASSDPATMPVKQIAAVHFKNVVRKRWCVSGDSDEATAPIPDSDRNGIKSNLVSLMCGCPGGSSVKSQLSESISLISRQDFPKVRETETT